MQIFIASQMIPELIQLPKRRRPWHILSLTTLSELSRVFFGRLAEPPYALLNQEGARQGSLLVQQTRLLPSPLPKGRGVIFTGRRVP